MEKYKKSHINTICLKYQFQHGMKVWSTWRIISCVRYWSLFWVYLKKKKKKHGEKIDEPSVRIDKLKIELLFKLTHGII